LWRPLPTVRIGNNCSTYIFRIFSSFHHCHGQRSIRHTTNANEFTAADTFIYRVFQKSLPILSQKP
jgi:hypothetical protein